MLFSEKREFLKENKGNLAGGYYQNGMGICNIRFDQLLSHGLDR